MASGSASIPSDGNTNMDMEHQQNTPPLLFTTIPKIEANNKISCTENQQELLYIPKLISIGPYHHDEEKYMAMEEIKGKYFEDFLRRNILQTKKEASKSLFDKVKSKRDYIMKHYPGVVGENWKGKEENGKLVKMFVYDGCFIIEFLLKWYLGDQNIHLSSAYAGVVRSDLLLLENQIPWFVLTILFSQMIHSPDEVPYSFTELALRYLLKKKEPNFLDFDIRTEDIQIHHLLHLYHIIMTTREFGVRTLPKKNIWSNIFRLHTSNEPRKYKTATERDEAGVKFESKDDMSFIDIKFVDGKLIIPSLAINTGTMALLLNLHALEVSVPNLLSCMPSYFAFMDEIIDTVKDVRVLQNNHIFKVEVYDVNTVSHLFNKLGSCVGKSQKYKGEYGRYIEQLTVDMDNYCQSPINRAFSDLKKTYFSSPWTIISLIVGIYYLFITSVQTYFTAYPPKN